MRKSPAVFVLALLLLPTLPLPSDSPSFGTRSVPYINPPNGPEVAEGSQNRQAPGVAE
jgi:hypothetical protein